MPEKVSNFPLEDQEIFSKSKFKDPGRCEISLFLKTISQKLKVDSPEALDVTIAASPWFPGG